MISDYPNPAMMLLLGGDGASLPDALAIVMSASLAEGITTERMPYLCPDCRRPGSVPPQMCVKCERWVNLCCAETDGNEYICHRCLP